MVEKTYSSGTRSEYELTVSYEELIEEMERYRGDLAWDSAEEEMERKWKKFARRTYFKS